MLLTRFWRAAVAAAALALVAAQDDESPNGQSTFVSPGGDVSFAFTVPDNGNTDVFFTMRAHVDNSWAAVGLGSDDMKGALFLMVYRNDRGDNVTFSPRLAYGNYEPQHYPELRYELLPGTGVIDDHMVLVAKCIEHCRSWPAADSNSGYIDVSSPNQKAIYALGPSEGFRSNSPAADLKFHREFGVFTIDMKRTQGSPDAPILDAKSKAVGTSLDYRKTHKSDYKAGLHGAFMARWHGVNQAVGVAGVLAGLALGILTSFNYQRSRGFRSYHQIFGFVIVGFILGQFTLGVLHHQKFRKTKAPTKFGMAHLWLGRIILFLGTLNAFFGFTFALNRKFGMVLAGLIILGAFAILFLSVGRQFLFKKKRTRGAGDPLGGVPTGYQAQPWRADQHPPPGAGYPSEPPPGYEPPSQQIGLQPVSHSPAAPSPWKSSDAKDYEDHPALGGAQRPREFA
ncbi:cytochrome domain of cellobiose dehydrogenase [Hirsutella rhossiliensis]|uniref:Cytochrome domain of cellobiose dehydrogenase n=1 Tax=Hirsutella rhossiliensis TaxID=111463 RepID=A0A9P8SJI4_9HYPO|nr:cytochrome domain of cellobiose dehydrogenase [Hirsutella rhossiliensis]KAH0963755.1 cytochrome domain of cellobiose dehydrogenase [Hirsutella rhossiliensis]